MNIIKVICENDARPVLKNVWHCAHARNHVICLRWPKCLNAVVLADVDLPYWTSKVEHIAAFTAIFSNICTAHAPKRLFMNFRCKFRHHRFADPDFLLECKISAIWRRFPLIFAFYILNVRLNVLLPVCLTYSPRKYTTRFDPNVDNFHQVWSWYDHPLPSYSVFDCWYVTWPCDFDLWPFDL